MKSITDKEIELAKKAIEHLKYAHLSPEDAMLAKKYPKHTLAAARYIDSAPDARPLTGCRCAFELIQLQERSNFHLTDTH